MKTASDVPIDANRQYQEVLEEWTSGSPDTLAMEYALGPSILWQRSGAGEQRWFHGDAQMSTRILTTTATPPTVASKLAYEAFGSDVGLSGAAPTSMRYTGQQFDAATQGYYLRARYMSPGTGTFLSVDSHSGELSNPITLTRFVYAGNNPIDQLDPSGRNYVVDTAIAGAVMGMLIGISVGGLRAHMDHRGWPDIVRQAAVSGMYGIAFGAVAGALYALSAGSVIAATAFNTVMLTSFGAQAVYAMDIVQDPTKSITRKAFEIVLTLAALVTATKSWQSGPPTLRPGGIGAMLGEAVGYIKASTRPPGGQALLARNLLGQVAAKNPQFQFGKATAIDGSEVFFGYQPVGRNVLVISPAGAVFRAQQSVLRPAGRGIEVDWSQMGGPE